MGKVKGEHIVPQCYLNMFSDDEKLNLFDKTKGEIRLNQSISKIAKQKAFYDFSEEELEIIQEKYPTIVDVQYIERFFSNSIEPGLKSCLEAVKIDNIPYFEDRIVQLEDGLKLHLAVQMAYQFFRTQGLREQLPDSLIMNRSLIQKQILIDDGIIAQLAKYFYDYKWTLLINKTNIPFYTSDNPVCIYDNLKDEVGLKVLEYGDRNYQMIYYPYSSDVAVMLQPINFSSTPSSIVTYVKEKFQVDYQNALQYKNSINYIFSKDKMKNIDELISFSDSFKEMSLSNEDKQEVNNIFRRLIRASKDNKIDESELIKIEETLKSIIQRIKK